MNRAIQLIRELDGKVNALGMGGIDLYVTAGGRKYPLRDAFRMAKAAKVTPIVDGSGLKDTLERRVVGFLVEELGIDLADTTVLLVCAVARFGMAEAFAQRGARLIMGDLIFTLGIPFPIRTLATLRLLARILAPIITQLPIRMLYPIGREQERINSADRYERFYREADIVAGDFHFIKKYMPARLDHKIILTNTVTAADVEMLRDRGASMLITTTPEMGGRSFGVNVVEAILVSISGKHPDELTPQDYEDLLDRVGFKPRVVRFGQGGE